MNDMSPEMQWYFDRVKELRQGGYDWIHASGQASFERYIRQWPSGWGDTLRILVYGDFKAPPRDLEFPELGITVHCTPREGTVINHAFCVLEATVRVDAKTAAAVVDAVRRINILLGAWTLTSWSQSGIGWWCHITSEFGGGGFGDLRSDDLSRATAALMQLPKGVRQRIENALYWIREPHALLKEHRASCVRKFSAYWNAFECVVDAVEMLRPQAKLTAPEKQRAVTEFLANRPNPTPDDIRECYQTIVNPGLVGKASHALRVCFGDDAEHYIWECFKRKPRRERLYDVRNEINHGDVDAENPEELHRIEARLTRLWFIVWGMFGRILPVGTPVDAEAHGGPKGK